MPQVGKFTGYARQVAGRWVGNDQKWFKVLTDALTVEGRIPIPRASDYIRGQASSKEIVVIEFLPGSPEDEDSSSNSQDMIEYRTLLDYFASRERYGVLPNHSTYLKDMYLVPLGKDDPLPDFIRVLNDVSLQVSIPRVSDSLLAVLILKYQTWSSDIKKLKATPVPNVAGPYVPPNLSRQPPQTNAHRYNSNQTNSGLLANLMSGTAQGQPLYSGHSFPSQPMPNVNPVINPTVNPAVNVSLLLAQLQGVLPSFNTRHPQDPQ